MTADVIEWRDSRRRNPSSADDGVLALRAILDFARSRGFLSINVAENVPALCCTTKRPPIIWTAADIDRFAQAASLQGKEHILDGLRLALLTGLRRKELVLMTWAQMAEVMDFEGSTKYNTPKLTKVFVKPDPALDTLMTELRMRRRKEYVETVLVNSLGQSWTAEGFGGSFNRVCDAAEIVHFDRETGRTIKKHLEDVRATFCVRLIAELGFNTAEAAAVMQWPRARVRGIWETFVKYEAR